MLLRLQLYFTTIYISFSFGLDFLQVARISLEVILLLLLLRFSF